MAKFFYPYNDAKENFVFTNVNVNINYLCTGVNVNAFMMQDIEAGEGTTREIFLRIKNVEPSSFSTYGILIPQGVQNVLDKILAGFPNYNAKKMPALKKIISDTLTPIANGEEESFERAYILTIRIPLSKIMEIRDTNDLDENDVIRYRVTGKLRSLENTLYKTLNTCMPTKRVHANFMQWIYDYLTLGNFVETPAIPTLENTPKAAPINNNRKAYPDLIYNPLPDMVTKPGTIPNPTKMLFNDRGVLKNMWGKLISNYNKFGTLNYFSLTRPDTATEVYPHGLTTYHSSFAIAYYAPQKNISINDLTALANYRADVTINTSQHYIFDQSAINTDRISTNTIINQATETSNTKNTIGKQYSQSLKKQEAMEAIEHFTKDGRNDIGLKVSTFFHLTSPNPQILTTATQDLIKILHSLKHTCTQPLMGQEQLFNTGIPGSPLTIMAESYMQTTSIENFSASQPWRTSSVGDEEGILIARNKNNALNQCVFFSPIKGIDAGNNGITLDSVPGGGKSHEAKIIGMWTLAALGVLIITDPGEHRDQIKFFNQVSGGEASICAFDESNVCIDPLVIIPDPDAAGVAALNMCLSLCELSPTDEKATILGRLLTPDSIRIKKIVNFNALMYYISKDVDLKSVYSTLKFISTMKYARNLFNTDYKPFDITGSCLLFGTHKINRESKGTIQGVFNTTMKKYLTDIIRYRFSLERDTGVICTVILEEYGLEIKSGDIFELALEIDKTGRKGGRALIAIEQNPLNFGEAFDLIPTRWSGQASDVEQAVVKCTRLGVSPLVPVLNYLTYEVGTKMYGSVLDFTHAGEGLLRDRNGVVAKVKNVDIYDKDLKALSNTVASQMLRGGL